MFVFGQFEGFDWFDRQQVIRPHIMCLMRFVGLFTRKLLYLYQVIEQRYLRFTAFLLFLLNRLHHQVVQWSLLCTQISDIIPKFRRLNLFRLHRYLLLLSWLASLIFLLMNGLRKVFDLLDQVLYLSAIIKIRVIIRDPIVYNLLFYLKCLSHVLCQRFLLVATLACLYYLINNRDL